MSDYGGDALADLHKALYAPHSSPAIAVESATTFASEARRALRVHVVLLGAPPRSALAHMSESGVGIDRMDANQDDTVFALSLSREWGRKRRYSSQGHCLLVQSDYSPAYYFLSDFGGQFWRNVLGFLIRRCYPQFSLPSLSTDEMEELLVALAEKFSAGPGLFRILRFHYTVPIHDPDAMRERATAGEFTDLSLSLAFGQAREQAARVNRVDFEVRGVCRGHLTCEGELGFTGDFSVFREVFINGIARIGGESFAKLDQRERVAANAYAARPFFIEYPEDILASTESRKGLLAALARMSHTSQSVIHDNPYVHVAILDYLEGTSCDLYVLSPKRSSIVPQTRSSPTSLARVYAHISREFAEGELRDYTEVYPT